MIDLKCIVELVKAVFLSLCRCFYLCLGKKKKKMDLCKYTVMWLGIVMWQCIFFHKKEGSCVDLCGVFHEGTWGSGAAGSKPAFLRSPGGCCLVCVLGWVLGAPAGVCSSAAAGAFVNPCVPPVLLFCWCSLLRLSFVKAKVLVMESLFLHLG